MFYSTPATATSALHFATTNATNLKFAVKHKLPKMWVTFDKNRTLREGKRRARGFGASYKLRHGNAFWRIIDNLLIIDDIVVGPVTLILGSIHWRKLAAQVTLARQKRKTAYSYKKKPSAQVNLRLFLFCTAIYHSLEFLDNQDNDAVTLAHLVAFEEEDIEVDKK